MVRTCSCGGKLQRTDIVGEFDHHLGRVMYRDVDPLKANWNCSRCGRVYTQRKRQSRKSAMLVLICGDRNWTSREAIRREMLKLPKETVIMEGEARGADKIAADIAIELGFTILRFPAKWKEYGKAAGPVRNQQMISLKPDLVLAFHPDLSKSKGTKDTVRRARWAGIPTQVFQV